jgi:hypothetical protein
MVTASTHVERIASRKCHTRGSNDPQVQMRHRSSRMQIWDDEVQSDLIIGQQKQAHTSDSNEKDKQQ